MTLPPTTRWSAHAVIRLSNRFTASIHIPRHASSILHDYQLRLRNADGSDVPTRMMLQIPDRPQSPSRLTLKPSETHEEGLQLGMLFALRPGERYTLSIIIAIHHEDKPDPTLLKIDEAHFTVTAD